MNSIDLIPVDYREGIVRQSRLRLTMWIVFVICALVVLSSVILARESKQLKQNTESLQSRYALSALRREQLETLDTRLAELEEELMLLQGLRSGAAAEDLFLIIDHALPGNDVWFVSWDFQRAGVIVSQAPQTVSTGYFIVIPQGQQTAEQPEWRVKTHMRINGQARDHAALSRFVRGLYGQTEIQDVKLNHTRVRKYENTTVVDFELAVVLYNEPAA